MRGYDSIEKSSDGTTILHIYSLEAWQPNNGGKRQAAKELIASWRVILIENVACTAGPFLF